MTTFIQLSILAALLMCVQVVHPAAITTSTASTTTAQQLVDNSAIKPSWISRPTSDPATLAMANCIITYVNSVPKVFFSSNQKLQLYSVFNAQSMLLNNGDAGVAWNMVLFASNAATCGSKGLTSSACMATIVSLSVSAQKNMLLNQPACTLNQVNGQTVPH